MSNMSVGGNQPVNFSTASAPLAEMNLEQLMMYVVFQRMDANAMQLRQHASEMDARTQKLEILGKFSQALGKVASTYKSDAAQELKNTDLGKKFLKQDWSAIKTEMNQTPEQKKAKLDSMTQLFDKNGDENYANQRKWSNRDLENLASTGYELGIVTQNERNRDIHFSTNDLMLIKQKMEKFDVNVPIKSGPVYGPPELQGLKDNMSDLAELGRKTGLMTDSDISRLSKGEFKKSEIEALQASIKTEQDKIGNENTKQQLTLQSITGRLEAITNLAGTLTKKIGDLWNAILQKT